MLDERTNGHYLNERTAGLPVSHLACGRPHESKFKFEGSMALGLERSSLSHN